MGDRIQLQQVHAQPDHERHRVHDRRVDGWHPRARNPGGAHEVDGAPGILVAVRDAGVGHRRRTVSTGFSTRSTRRRRRAWGWGCRSVGRSSRRHGGRLWATAQCRPGRDVPVHHSRRKQAGVMIDDGADGLRRRRRSRRAGGDAEPTAPRSGLRVETFKTAQEFLDSPRPDAPACLVLDVRLPGLSGLDLQRELIGAGVAHPHRLHHRPRRHPMSVQAMKAGAVEFLTKPFRDQELLDAIQQAIDRDRVERRRRSGGWSSCAGATSR